MKFPFLPLQIDSFNRLDGAPDDARNVYLLSHFHTDHMAGLSGTWARGTIVASAVTAELLLAKFPTLSARVTALPFWERRALLTRDGPPTRREAVHVTLLPAQHIPGSAMFVLEVPGVGTALYTGDFKYAGPAVPLLERFFRARPVDHVFFDDTWLHLGAAAPPGANDGSAVLSKLLSAEQAAEAVEAIGRRLDAQARRHAQQGAGQIAAAAAAPLAGVPYVLRVYLHNQFGKETLLQRVAERLGTRVVVGDDRYRSIATVVAALHGGGSRAASASRPQAGGGDAGEAPRQSLEGSLADIAAEWEAAGGEGRLYPLSLDHFVSYTQHHADLAAGRYDADSFPRVEVVTARRALSAEALQEAARRLEAAGASPGVPHYTLIVSGWAGMNQRGPGAATAWQMPTTLHCTPEEIVSFVRVLRPRSVTPLHYRPSRGAVVLQRLGPLLREPYVNSLPTEGGGEAPAAARGPWRRAAEVMPEEEAAAATAQPAVDVEAEEHTQRRGAFQRSGNGRAAGVAPTTPSAGALSRLLEGAVATLGDEGASTVEGSRRSKRKRPRSSLTELCDMIPDSL